MAQCLCVGHDVLWGGGLAMVIRWSKEFDRVCGADLRNSLGAPAVDSGIHDWLYGKAEAFDATEMLLNTLPAGRRQGRIREELCTPHFGSEPIVKKPH